jgi:adenylate kinase
MNVLVTGSPGVGKSQFAQALQKKLAELGFFAKILSVSDLVKEEKLYEEYDEQLDTYIMKDSKVKRRVKELLSEHNWIVESHTVSVIPRGIIDYTFILRVPNTALYYDRLAARGYSKAKIEENVDCEIMQVVWQEAVERFVEENCDVVVSETPEQLADAVDEAIEVYRQLYAIDRDENDL